MWRCYKECYTYSIGKTNYSFFFSRDPLCSYSCWLFTSWQYCIAFILKIIICPWSVFPLFVKRMLTENVKWNMFVLLNFKKFHLHLLLKMSNGLLEEPVYFQILYFFVCFIPNVNVPCTISCVHFLYENQMYTLLVV